MTRRSVLLAPAFAAGGLFAQTAPLRSIWGVEVLVPGRTVGTPRRLISSARGDWNPSFSPDGKRIVFESLRGPTRQNWVAASDGTGAFQLTHLGEVLAGTPRWSPDGARIAFDATDGEIRTIPAGGGDAVNLTANPAREALPSWSRDSRRVYFTSNRGGAYEIWSVPAAGGPAVRVTEGGAETGYESADSKSLFYTRWGKETGLWRRSLTGGSETRVLDSVVYRAFAVRADGIYFLTRPKQSEPVSLAWLDLASGEQRKLAALEGPFWNGFSVSSDGRYIIYSRVETE